MSTKTIAVETSVYERLAREKRESESFTRTISRLVDHARNPTCAAAVTAASALWESVGNEADARVMEGVVKKGRKATNGSVEPVR